MATPNRKPRRPLGSLAGNLNISSNNSPSNNISPPFDPRDPAIKASSNVLTPKVCVSYNSTAARRLSGTIMNGNNASSDLEVGDTVAVPGGMTGVVKFLGPVQGKNGVFAGVELSREYASRGKNDGDVDGVRYFTTSVSGSGIFLPSHRASKQESPTLSASTFPPTPTTPSFQNFDLRKSSAKARTPPTPSIPKFSQSVGTGARHPFSQTVGPGARAPSPQLKSKGRPSLPRPESPARNQPKLQATPGRPSIRGFRPPASPAPLPASKSSKPSTPVATRSTSRSQSRQGQPGPSPEADDTPTAVGRANISARSFSNNSNNRSSVANDESQRLQQKLEERDKQLKEQAASLAEMESSLAELQSLMAANSAAQRLPQAALSPDASTDGDDVSQLRSLVREKNDKIQMLTAEFDSHRADFRSTIDTLEMASTETERVYEKRVQELLQEVYELQSGREDVATVASQLKQLEELVQELEEGLEDARRGEAEARGEVEFLRGEIERARLELRREREKASKALAGADAAVGEHEKGSSPSNDSRGLEQRDDEIRGLKAIIHSLSSGPEVGSSAPEARSNGSPSSSSNANIVNAEELHKLQDSIAALQREKSDLKGLIDRKNLREEELERENSRLRDSGSRNGSIYHQKADSSSTATMHTANRMSNTSATTAIRPGSTSYVGYPAPPNPSRLSKNSGSGSGGSRPASGKPVAPPTIATEIESIVETEKERGLNGSESRAETVTTEDSESASVDTDSLWCELCETTGHDILTCSRMFGETGQGAGADDAKAGKDKGAKREDDLDRTITQASVPDEKRAERKDDDDDDAEERSFFDADEDGKKEQSTNQNNSWFVTSAAPTSTTAQPPADGPAAGKTSGVIDMTKWCALCEKDGHESVDCPFEEDYY